jgi:type IV pilus assembly protein PilE
MKRHVHFGVVRHTGDHPRHPAQGFTVLELLVTVVIVSILVALAVPSYLQHVRRGARNGAQAFMMDAAARQQQYLVDRRAYASTVAALNTTPPAHVASKYAIAVVAANGPPPTFVLTANPTGDQAADSCGVLTIDSQGNRAPVNCW